MSWYNASERAYIEAQIARLEMQLKMNRARVARTLLAWIEDRDPRALVSRTRLEALHFVLCEYIGGLSLGEVTL